MASKVMTLGLGLVVWAACERVAPAKTTSEPSAPGSADPVSILETTWQPSAKLAGAARTQRACADVEKLIASASALPKTPPAGSALDSKTWRLRVETTVDTARDLSQACKAPDKRIKDVLGHFQTADVLSEATSNMVRVVVDGAKPRLLPPAMKTFDTTLRHMVTDKKHKNGCQDRNVLAKALPGLEAAPAGVDGGTWTKAFEVINRSVEEMKGYYCPGVGGDGEGVFDSSLSEMHGSFYTLVSMLPLQK
jgi:hypothetical protein